MLRRHIIGNKQKEDKQIFTDSPYLGLKVLCLKSWKTIAVISALYQNGLKL